MKNIIRNYCLAAVAILLLSIVAFQGKASAAACSVKNPLGSVTYNVTISQAGDYKLWARIRPESKSANTVYLEIDGNACLTVGADDSLPARTWKWVDYGGEGNAKKFLLHKFESAGKHTIKVIGNESGVGVDRILLLAASDTCLPSNTISGTSQPGDNCKSEQAAVAEPDDSAGGSTEIAAKPPMSLPKKIGIVLSVLLLLGLLGGGGFLLWRRFKAKKLGAGKDGAIILPKQ